MADYKCYLQLCVGGVKYSLFVTNATQITECDVSVSHYYALCVLISPLFCHPVVAFVHTNHSVALTQRLLPWTNQKHI